MCDKIAEKKACLTESSILLIVSYWEVTLKYEQNPKMKWWEEWNNIRLYFIDFGILRLFASLHIYFFFILSIILIDVSWLYITIIPLYLLHNY